MPTSSEQPPLKHRARKRFGQNFLNDANIIDKIVRGISPKADDNLVEIGPGQGAITAPLLAACPNLNVVEIDQDLIPILLAQFAKYKHFKIHREDALKFDFATLAEKRRINSSNSFFFSSAFLFCCARCFAANCEDSYQNV